MNYWIRRNHKRQSDAIITFLSVCSTDISFGMNLYSRSTHSIRIDYKNKITLFTITRLGKQWSLIQGNYNHTLPQFDSYEFWEQLGKITTTMISVIKNK